MLTDTLYYRSGEDTPFLPKDIFSSELYVKDLGAYVLAGEFGKCYEVKFPKGAAKSAVTVCRDPKVGEMPEATAVDCDFTTQDCFMFVYRSIPEYLVIYVDAPSPHHRGACDQCYLPP